MLYQLPPNWSVNIPRLGDFLRSLPRRRHHAIEFRDPGWYCDEVYALLNRYGVVLCLHDMAGSATGRIAIGPVRLRPLSRSEEVQRAVRRSRDRRVGGVDRRTEA